MRVKQDVAVEEGLRAVFRAFREIPIVIDDRSPSVTLSPPYYVNGSDRRTGAEARRAASPAVASFLQEIVDAHQELWPNARRVITGKGRPQEIALVVQEALRRGLITLSEAGGEDALVTALRQWMADYGLGIDCSGFAQQALTAVCDLLPGGEMLPAITQRQISSQGFATPPFTLLSSPLDLQPGDTMVLAPPPNYPFGHVRLIAHAEPQNDSIEFVTLEATSEGGPPEPDPSKHQPLSAGPLERRWRYSEGDLHRWDQQTETWQASPERPRFARLGTIQG